MAEIGTMLCSLASSHENGSMFAGPSLLTQLSFEDLTTSLDQTAALIPQTSINRQNFNISPSSPTLRLRCPIKSSLELPPFFNPPPSHFHLEELDNSTDDNEENIENHANEVETVGDEAAVPDLVADEVLNQDEHDKSEEDDTSGSDKSPGPVPG